MQFDKRKSSVVNQMSLEMIMTEEDRRGLSHRSNGYPLPPPSFTQSHTPLSHFEGRRSTDTPLSMYATHRAKYKMTVLSSILSPRQQHSKTVQVPLSALSSAKVRPGVVGGSFNSTSKMKCIPLPSIYDHNQMTRRGVRNITLHSDRYTPSFRSGNQTRTTSDSLLHIPDPSRQKCHLMDRELDVHRSRSLKKDSEVIPHRLERAFYMNGHSAQFFNRQDLTPEELSTLQAISLSQNKELFYGKGMRSARLGGGRGRNRAVQRFESQLIEAAEERKREYDDFSIDVGRMHQVSRAVTPAVTIPEEDMNDLEEEEEEEEGEGEREKEESKMSKAGETFITESESQIRDTDGERTDC